jgi:hypothetical protein
MTESEGGTTLLFHSLSSEIIYATTVNHGVHLLIREIPCEVQSKDF